eukprot:2426221-Amphidinium_carterae.1
MKRFKKNSQLACVKKWKQQALHTHKKNTHFYPLSTLRLAQLCPSQGSRTPGGEAPLAWSSSSGCAP